MMARRANGGFTMLTSIERLSTPLIIFSTLLLIYTSHSQGIIQAAEISNLTSIEAEEYNRSIEGTTIYSIPIASYSKIYLSGGKFLQQQDVKSTYKHFIGFVVRLHDTFVISCKRQRDAPGPQHIERGEIGTSETEDNPDAIVLPTNSTRYALERNEDWINITITDAQFSDTGLYVCGGDHKAVRILDAEKTPGIVGYSCTTRRYLNLDCKFISNVKADELVNWDIKFSVKARRMCNNGPCTNKPCDIKVESRPEDGVDVITCNESGFIFVSELYTFTVNGTGPYSSGVQNLSLFLNSDILLLNPPDINETFHATDSSVTLHVLLHWADREYGGYTIYHATTDGIKYLVTVINLNHQDPESKPEERQVLFVTKNDTEFLNITGLLPYTEYKFTIITQINGTDNPEKWSEPEYFIAKTKESRPSIAPKQSPNGFELIGHKVADCKQNERSVIVYWEAMSDKPNFGNGKITSYSISEEEVDKQRNITAVRHIYSTVGGDQTSAQVCVTKESVAVGVAAVTKAGTGKEIGWYYIPSQIEEGAEVLIRPCDIHAVFESPSDEMYKTIKLSWSSNKKLPGVHNYTVFWCERETETEGKRCKDKTISWRDVGSSQSLSIPAQINKGKLMFGLSVDGANQQRSGIVWAECLDNPSGELVPAALDITVSDLTANVTVKEKCSTRLNKRAEQYDIHYCLHDSDHCVSAVSVTTVSPCARDASILLEEHSSTYAFWVVSSAGDKQVRSDLVSKDTAARVLTGWEQGLIVGGCILLLILISIASIYVYRQKMRVNALRHPKLVAPTELKIETEMDTFTESSRDTEDEADSSLSEEGEQYFPTSNSFTPLLYPTSDTDFSVEVVVPKLYLNSQHSETTGYGSMPEDSRDNSGRTGYESFPSSESHEAPYPQNDMSASTIGYRPTMSGDFVGKSQTNFSGLDSSAVLPDEYLRCTDAPSVHPDNSLSDGLFYRNEDATVSDDKIDLMRFLSSSGMSALHNNKLAVDLPPARNHLDPSCDEDRLQYPDQSEESKQLLVDIPSGSDTAVPSSSMLSLLGEHHPQDEPNVLHEQPDSDRSMSDYVSSPQYPYLHVQDIRPTSELAEILEQSEQSSDVDVDEIQENSSGDSGYVGRSNNKQNTTNNASVIQHSTDKPSHANIDDPE